MQRAQLNIHAVLFEHAISEKLAGGRCSFVPRNTLSNIDATNGTRGLVSMKTARTEKGISKALHTPNTCTPSDSADPERK